MMRKTREASARQLLNWIAKNLPRMVLNSGDGTVSVWGGKGFSTARTSNPKDVEDALRFARRRDIKERAAIRRDKRDGVWPYNVDHIGRPVFAVATPAAGGAS